MEDYVVKFTIPAFTVEIETPNLSRKERITYAKEQVQATVKKVILYFLQIAAYGFMSTPALVVNEKAIS